MHSTALINRSAGLNVSTPGPPPAENIAPQPQRTVQGAEDGGSINPQFPKYVSGVLHRLPSQVLGSCPANICGSSRKPETLSEEAVEGVNAPTPGPPPTENITPQPQRVVQGAEGSGSINTQIPEYVSDVLHAHLHKRLDLVSLISGVLAGSQRPCGRRPWRV